LESLIVEKSRAMFELQNAVLRAVAELVECRDHTSAGHIERTQNYLWLLIDQSLAEGAYVDELSAWDLDVFIMSSQLHDVGKIAIRDDILLKPGRLSDEEFNEMKRHTSLGREIIERVEESASENELLVHAKLLAESHHEKWDGTGYPRGAKGEEIPLQGRLMALVDVYDALTNDRPYKEALTHEESVDIIRRGSGTHFDPLLTDAFLKRNRQFINILPAKRYRPRPTTQLNTLFKTVSNIVDIRSGSEGSHSGRMREYLKILLTAAGQHELFRDEISSWDMDIFLMSAQLHDIGKFAVSDNILGKPEKLTQAEYASVQHHAEFSVKIIERIKDGVSDASLFHHAEALAGSHHERWDGTGYPKGLKGREIPLQGRIMALVDVYDAHTNHRPHREMLDHREAVDTIKGLSGMQFDPDLVEVFLAHEMEFERIGQV
jgi:response regulator RpfG family c-di-GMP phosphodiesterase